MLKQTITYENYNGEKKTRELWFHLSKTELIRMVANGEMDPTELKKAARDKDPAKLFQMLEIIVQKAYGEKSEDGESFDKSENVWKKFTYSPVYDAFMMKMLDADSSAEFVKGILPNDMLEAAIKEIEANNIIIDDDKIEAEVQRRLALANAKINNNDIRIVQ